MRCPYFIYTEKMWIKLIMGKCLPLSTSKLFKFFIYFSFPYFKINEVCQLSSSHFSYCGMESKEQLYQAKVF